VNTRPTELEGQVAIVTGSGRGIGRSEALLLAAQGAQVVVNDIDDAAEEVAAEITSRGGVALAVVSDVTSMTAAQEMVDSAVSTWGRLDILVNNAGILRDRMFHNMTEEDWDVLIEVNLKGHFTVTRAAVPHLRAQRSGRIINTASESGLGTAGSANYSASKEAIIGLTRTLAIELGWRGITVNAIRPRAWTPLAASIEDEVRRRIDQIDAGELADPGPPTVGTAVRRKLLETPELMSPDAVAALVVFLCSAQAGNITGADFIVSGDEITLLAPYPEPRLSMYRDQAWDLDSIQKQFFTAMGGHFAAPVLANIPTNP
jgi:NAD(P)-dependent dehydrogenase (short-subunit alcohol dehydrogenase family)